MEEAGVDLERGGVGDHIYIQMYVCRIYIYRYIDI